MSDTIINSYNYYISSAKRDSGTPADFTIFLKTPLFLNGTIPSEFRFKLQYIQVPFSFSQFNTQNSKTEYILTRNGIVYNSDFSIATGNYNINTFLTEWISKLKTSLNSIAGYNPLITATYSSDTNLCTFSLPADIYGDTSILFLNRTNIAVNLALGFNANWTLLQNSSRISLIDVNVSPSRNLYLLSDTLIQGRTFDAINTGISNSNILSVIPITVQPNQYITLYYNPAITSILNNAVVDKINFQLKDQSLNNDLVDFDLDYTLFFIIEEHRSFTSRELTESISNLRAGTIMPQSFPPQFDDIEQRRERLLRARGKLTGRLLKIKDELENKILPTGKDDE